MLRVAICQSNYIPWKGYFDLINSVDLFIFHDDVQYTKQDWRNRNRIKTPGGVQWLTIPVGSDQHRLICEVALPDNGWQEDHWHRLCLSYSKAPFFNEYRPALEEIYLGTTWKWLSVFNRHLITTICAWLGISTQFCDSRSFRLTGVGSSRVVELLRAVGASHYLSGPSAKNYLDLTDFIAKGLILEWIDYTRYLEYDQLWPPFQHRVTALDVLFHIGGNARHYILGGNSTGD